MNIEIFQSKTQKYTVSFTEHKINQQDLKLFFVSHSSNIQYGHGKTNGIRHFDYNYRKKKFTEHMAKYISQKLIQWTNF